MLFLHELNFCFNFKCTRYNLHLKKKTTLVSSIFKSEKRFWGQNIWDPLHLAVFALHSFLHSLGFLGFGFHGNFLVAGSLFQSELPLHSLVILSNPPSPPAAPNLSTPAVDFYQKNFLLRFLSHFQSCTLRIV